MTISSDVLIKIHLYTERNKNETKVLEKVRFITKRIIIENRYLICDKFYVIIMILKELLINVKVKVVPK